MLLWQIVKKTLFCATIWIWGPPFLAWCCWQYLFVDPVYLPPPVSLPPAKRTYLDSEHLQHYDDELIAEMRRTTQRERRERT